MTKIKPRKQQVLEATSIISMIGTSIGSNKYYIKEKQTACSISKSSYISSFVEIAIYLD
jgi:hypothetical protein